MHITLIGYILIPLGIVLFIFGPGFLFYAFVFFIPFSASAVVNVSSITFGFPVSYYFAILWMIRRGIDYLSGGKWIIPKVSRNSIIALLLFLAVALISLIMPFIINGKLMVYGAQGETGFSPVRFCIFNLTQFLYLAFGVFLTLFIVPEVRNREILVRLIKVYLFSALFVCVWGLQQPPEHLLGIDYPTLFNNSTSNGASGYLEAFGRIQRISSVAVEPSVFSRYLFSIIPLSLVCTVRKSKLWKSRSILFIFSFLYILTAVLTTSTVAYLGLALTTTIMLLLYLKKDLQVFFKAVFILSTILLVIGALFLLSYFIYPTLTVEFFHTVKEVTVHKITKGSGAERLEVGENALQAFANYPIIGIGWGSAASHDMITKLLSNTGIIGFSCFILFLFLTCMLFKTTYKTVKTQEDEILMEGIGISLCVLLLTNMVAGFDFVFPHLWFLFGIVFSLPNLIEKESVTVKKR